MAISQKKASEVEEEEYEEFEEMEIEEEVEDDDYEEAFEEEEEVFEQKEEDLEEEEMEQSEEDEEEIEQSEEDEEDEKKVVRVEEEESVKESAMEEDKTVNRKEPFESDIEQNDEEEEEEIEQIEEDDEEIEPSEEDEEDEKKVVKVEEEEESVKESAMEENKKVNRKQLSESDVEQNDEEEEIEPSEEDEEDVKKLVKVEEEEESVKESAMEENKKANRKQLSESDVEQNDEEEEIEPSEEDEEIEHKIEEEESVKESAMEENKKVNRKQLSESDLEQNDEEDEETEHKTEEEESVQESSKQENNTLNPKKPSESDKFPFTPPAESPPLLQSITDLEKLHCALSKFLHEYNSFSRSLESISSAIDEHTSLNPALNQKEKDKRSCVEIFCEEMNGKALRKYIESNVKDIHRLRNEVSEALKRVPNPEKLVLDAIGKFYTQGRKACDNNKQLVLHRRASILLLEFFLLSGRAIEDNSVRVEANHGALLWWKRLVNENIGTASVEDCVGFVLFIACFGISTGFASRDLCFLLLKSDLKKKISVLRRSSILVQKIPGIIKDLIRGEMYYEAAELSCFFELTDTFPPLPLLSSLVARVIQAAKVEREKSAAFPNLVRQADSWELTSLRSVVKFLEYHKFGKDSLDSVHIHKRISELENCIDGDAAVLLNNIRKRKVRNHATARSKSRARSKKSFPSTQKTPQNPPSQMIQNNPEKELPSHPLLPENSALSAAVWERRTYFGSPASFRSSAMESKTLQNPPSEMIQKKPEIEFPSHLLHPNSDVENSAVSVAGWGRRAYLESLASYRSSAMECSSGQQFYQRQALGYGNGGGGFPGRDLYKFADTVEAQLSKSRRSSNTSPGGAKFGYY